MRSSRRETDKSTQEIYATESGIVAQLLVSEGETVECNSDIMVLVDEGEEYDPQKEETPVLKEEPAQEETEKEAHTPVAPAPARIGSSGARVRVSPLAKKIAQEKRNRFSYNPSVGSGRAHREKRCAAVFRKRSGVRACCGWEP